ncbi:MAG: hypothetical protein F6K22_09010 [Okeania sp. SIO2F4]|uniref:hypothetical protein n=1 Tax=Okeania sp. SIO2F4 TaxID=2607790 RepID=UPI00142A0A2E|nr:hypothetical protein [Okeania sp. SIO2F4]NES02973.1 hypothetical protein [Okeania sp. SIO2F4]
MEAPKELTHPEKTQQFRTRLFPGQFLPPEEIARRKTAKAEFSARCRVVFEKLRPQLIEKYYNWFIAVDPDSEEYLIDSSLEGLLKKVRNNYPDGIVKLTTYRLNEIGVCGKI